MHIHGGLINYTCTLSYEMWNNIIIIINNKLHHPQLYSPTCKAAQ